MSETNGLPTVLVVTSDQDIVQTVSAPWPDGNVFVCASLTEGIQILEDKEINVVAIDFKGNIENLSFALSDIRDLSPSCSLILFCDTQDVQTVVESDIGGSIFRIIPKPAAIGQSQLAFKSAFRNHLELLTKLKQGEDLSIDLEPEGQQSQLKYVFIIFLVILLGWLLFEISVDDESDQEQHQVTQTDQQTPGLSDTGQVAQSDLLEQAGRAFDVGDLEHAANLYTRLLEMDAYDGEALSGLNKVTSEWAQQIQASIDSGNSEKGIELLALLSNAQPDHPALATLESGLRDTPTDTSTKPVEGVADITPAERLTEDPSVSTPMEDTPVQTETPAEQTSEQDQLLARIDDSLQNDPDHLLVQGEAFRLLLNARQAEDLSVPYNRRWSRLQERLQSYAKVLIDSSSPGEIQSLRNALNVSDSFASLVASLDGALEQIQARQRAAANPAVFAAGSKIIPAIKISGPKPRYPRNAERRGIEGFVELEFTINTSGSVTNVLVMRAEPQGVFEDSAINALSKWRYQPRMVDDTPVSEIKQIRMGFRL